MAKHTNKMPRPAKRGVIAVRDEVSAIREFREVARVTDRKPSDAAREALRDWTSKQQALFGLLALVLLALVPSMAFAADVGSFAVPAGDVSMEHFMKALFSMDGSSPLVSTLRVFNSAVLVVGGIYMAHNIIAGTLATAHDGEMLGKKWSTMWLPIRTTLGAAAIMPTIGGGFCVAQAAVVWLATMGIGIADAEWNAFAQSPATGASYSAPSQTRAWRTAAEQMFVLATCAEASQQEYEISMRDSGGATAAYLMDTPTKITALKGGDWGFSVDTSMGACGALSLPHMAEADAQETGANAIARSLVNVRKLRAQVGPAQQSATQAMWTAVDALAKRQVKGELSAAELNSALDQATQAYGTTVRQAADAAAAANTNDDFVAALQRDGWANAGAFYTKISAAQDEITAAVSVVPSVYIRDPQDWIDLQNGWVAGQIKAAQGHLVGASLGGVENIGKPTQNDFMARALRWFLQSTKGVNPNGNSQNPVIAAKQFGNDLISWAWGGLSAGVGATVVGGIAAGNIAGKLTGADTALLGAINLISPAFFAMFSTLLIAGIMLAVLVPMLPFILWIGVVIGWLVLLVESMAGAPLWAVAHLSPDADGVVGKGGQGYMLVLGLTLRPALSIFGLVASIALMQPVGQWINDTFLAVFNMSVLQDNASWGGLTITVAGYLLYAGLMVMIINKVFSLSHVIPDQVLRWIGGHTEQLGQHAQEAGGAGKAALAGAAGGFAVTSQMGQKGAGIAKDLAENRANKKNEEQQALAGAARDVEETRGQALNSDLSRERNPNSPAAAQKQGLDHSRAAGAAMRQGALLDHSFAQGLTQAQEQDSASGGTQAVDAFLATQAKGADEAEAKGTPPTPGQRYGREALQHTTKAREAMEGLASILDAQKPIAPKPEAKAGEAKPEAPDPVPEAGLGETEAKAGEAKPQAPDPLNGE